VLFGGDLDRNPFWGGRFAAGYYFDDCNAKAIEVSGFFLGRRSADFTSSSFQAPVLARPFVAVNDNTQTVEYVSFPQAACGQVLVRAPSQLWGIESNFVCLLCCDCNYRFDLIAGFRYLDLRESITIQENVLFDSNLQSVDASGLPVLDDLAGANI